MMMVMFLCLSTLLQPAFGKECCKTKSVGPVEYVLADAQEDTTPYGCVDNCVYNMVADGPSSKNYCFKSGKLPVNCHGGSTNAAAGVCALNTDCDKCGNNVNTINGVRYCCASDCNSPTTIINGECSCGVGGHGGATGGMGGHGGATEGMEGHGGDTGGDGSSTQGMGGHDGATGGMGGHSGATGGMAGGSTNVAAGVCALNTDCDKCGNNVNTINGVRYCCASDCSSPTTIINGECSCGVGGHGGATGGHGSSTEGMGGHGGATGGVAAIDKPVERICKQDTDCKGCKSGQDLNGVRYCCADDCNSTDFSFSFTQEGVATCKCGTNTNDN